MIRKALAIMLLNIPLAALASADLEGRRESIYVKYETGETVSIECEAEDRCDLTLQNGKREWKVTNGKFRGLLLLPRQLSLVAKERNGRFVAQAEVACDVYSEGLPAYICMAQITVEDSQVVSTVVFKRTFADSRDAAPLIVQEEY